MSTRAQTAGHRLDELCNKQGLSMAAAIQVLQGEEAQRAQQEAEANSRTLLTDDEFRRLLGEKKQVEQALRAKVSKRDRTKAQLARDDHDVAEVAQKLAAIEHREQQHKAAEAEIAAKEAQAEPEVLASIPQQMGKMWDTCWGEEATQHLPQERQAEVRMLEQQFKAFLQQAEEFQRLAAPAPAEPSPPTSSGST